MVVSTSDFTVLHGKKEFRIEAILSSLTMTQMIMMLRMM